MCLRKPAGLLAVVIVAAAAASACSSAEARARRYLDAGNRYFDAQRYQEAVIEYRNALQLDPRFVEAHRMLAQTYDRLHDRAQAAHEQVRAADLAERDIDLQLKAASALLELKQFADARARAAGVLKREPSNVTAHILLGYALAGLQELHRAVAELEEGITLEGGGARPYLNLGMLHLARGQQDEAERAFTRALTIAPKSVDAHLAVAQWYWATSRRAEAEAAAKHALAIEPSNRRAHWMLAAMYVAMHRDAEVEAQLKAAAQGPSAAGPQFVLADYYMSIGRTSEALDLLRPLAANARYFAPATRRLASAELAAGRPTRAQALLDQLLARDPRNRAALTMKVRLLLDERNLDDALAQLQSATSAAPRWVEARQLLGDTYLAKGDLDKAIASFNDALKIDPNAIPVRVELAGLHLFAGDVDRAIVEICRALDRQPKDVAARLMLARALAARGDLAAAETELRTVSATGRPAAEVQTQLGAIHSARGHMDAASRAFSRALAIDPDSVEALAGLVVVNLRAHNNAEARRLVEARLTRSPETANLLLLAARTYAAIGDAPNTERMFRRALEKDPGNVQAHEQFGRFYIAERRWHDAQGQFDSVAAQRPKSLYAHTMIASLLQAQQKPREAEQEYQKVLAFDAQAGVAANNLAWLYVDSRANLDVALNLAQLAVTQMKDRPEVNDTLGWIYCAKGWYREAIPFLQTSVRLNPARALYHYHLGMAYLQAGDRENARRSVERALQRNPAFIDARQLLDRLAS